MKRAFLLVVAATAMVWAWSCGKGPTENTPAGVLNPVVLGSQPAPRQSDGGAGAAVFYVWVVGKDGEGKYGAPNADDIELTCGEGPCSVLERRVVPGSTAGILAVIVDDSGSNTTDPLTCTGCPTDPDGKRIAAVKALFQTLLQRAPKWKAALFDFGPDYNLAFKSVRLLAGYTSRAEDLVEGAGKLRAAGGTFLYNSIAEVLPTALGERLVGTDGGIAPPTRILIVSDGEDTNSTVKLADALDAGVQAAVALDAVGYGQVDGGATPYLAGKAYSDLRRCATSTGGLATLVSRDTLPALFEQLAESYVLSLIHI